MKHYLFIIFSLTTIFNNSFAEEQETTNQLKCINLNEVKPSYSPPALFSASVACANKEEPMKAAQLFLFARIYGSYDMMRAEDHTARQVINILVQNTFKAMRGNADSVQYQINHELIKKPETFKAFCTSAKTIGKPNYHPTYMINHGMNAVLGKIKNNGIKENFNENQAWVKNMRNCG